MGRKPMSEDENNLFPQDYTSEITLLGDDIKFAAVVAASPMGMHFYEWHPERGLIFIGANPAADRLLGIKNEIFINKTIGEAFPPLLQTEIPDRYERAARWGEYWSTEQIDYDNETIRGAFEVHAFQISPNKMVAMFLDITTRITAEFELKKTKKYINNIINSMPSVLIGVNAHGEITQWNHSAERYYGKKAADVLGHRLTAINPSEEGEIYQAQTAIQEQRPIRKIRHRLSSESEPVHEDVTIFPLTANGVTGAVIRIDDVTEKVRLEELMIQSEKMLSVGGLAAGMAHEINNPIGGMVQSAQVIKQRLLEDMPANRAAAEEAGISMEALHLFLQKRNIPQMLNTIALSGQRASSIIRSMLDFARKGSGTKISCDPVELMEASLQLAANDYDLKKKFDFKKVALVKNYHEGLLLNCEPSKLEQVFLNILKNGAHAMAQKQTSLPAESSWLPQFSLTIAPGNQTIRIQIEDNGPGIPATIKHRIFEPFFSTKAIGEGTGLGLSVSYFIITEQHEGTMTVESEEGTGTLFTIEIPL